MSEYIVAIDLGSSKIAGMVAQKDSKGLLKILAVETEESAGIKRGLVVNSSEVAYRVGALLKKLENRVKIKIGRLYVSRGGHTLRSVMNEVSDFYDIDVEVTDKEISLLDEKNGLFALEGAKVYESFGQEYLIDGQKQDNPIGYTCKHFAARNLMIVGKKELDDRICSCLERIPQEYAEILTAPIVVGEALLSPHEKEMGCAVVDFGAETTSVVVYSDKYIRHAAVVPFGGQIVTTDIKDLQVTMVDAEKLKKTYGCALVTAEDQPKNITIPESPQHDGKEHRIQTLKLASIIEARMDEILEMVCKEIDASGYAKTLRGGIIITGGASQLRALPDLVQLKTGMNVKRATFDHLLLEPSDAQELTPAYSLLMGLVNAADKDCQVVEEENEENTPIEPVKPPRKKKFITKLTESLFKEEEDF